MKRRNKLLAGFIAAAVTFGTLMLVAGPENFAKYNRHHQGRHCMDAQEKPAPAATEQQ